MNPPENEYIELIKDFIAYGLWMRPLIHACHLDTNSYSRHIALETYYEEVDDLVDEIAEVSKGRYSIDLFQGIAGIPMKFTYERDSGAVEIIRRFDDFCQKLMDSADGVNDAWLSNLLQAVQALNGRTIYKLNYLH